jgi:hypothetical protein
MKLVEGQMEGDLSVTLNLHDWVWLCQMLAQALNHFDAKSMSKHDYDRMENCLDALEAAV